MKNMKRNFFTFRQCLKDLRKIYNSKWMDLFGEGIGKAKNVN